MRPTVSILALSSLLASTASAQPSDLRAVHERAVYATVRIETSGGLGSGWLLAQSGRPLVVTNAHVAQRVGRRARAVFYRGSSESPAVVPVETFHVSTSIDLGILRLLEDPPESARPVQLATTTSVVRGQRVVLAGNPGDQGTGEVLPFQTTEGVVTGHISGRRYAPCGRGRNCVVVDAASFRGSSGGPAFNVEGRLVGMLWGGPAQVGRTASRAGSGLSIVQNPTFSYLIHTRTIAAELRRLER